MDNKSPEQAFTATTTFQSSDLIVLPCHNRYGVVINGQGWWLSKRYFKLYDGCVYERESDDEEWALAEPMRFETSGEMTLATNSNGERVVIMKPVLAKDS